MSTSGSTDYALNARQVIEFALDKMRAVGLGQNAEADEMTRGKRELNIMLKGWQVAGPNLWRLTEASQTLTSGNGTYTLSTTKPIRITEARYRDANGRDMPMERLTREEYLELPEKTSSGIPTCFYFDPQRDAGVLYVWPVLATATTQVIRYSYVRRIEDIDDENNDLDVPPEYIDLIGYNLAARMLDNYGMADAASNRILQRASLLVQQARDHDREPIVRFSPYG